MVRELLQGGAAVGPSGQAMLLILPHDVISLKRGVHFTEDFKCVTSLPGLRSTAQNFILECKVTSRKFACMTLPLGSGRTAGCPDIENFREVMRSLDHFSLPRLV